MSRALARNTKHAARADTGYRRALLIGSDYGGLRGVRNDIEAMHGVLQRLGFQDLRVCEGADATRSGILDAIDALTAAAGPCDAVVVYYAGHGARVTHADLPPRLARDSRSLPEFVVPTDYSPAGCFRGILSWELSRRLWRLTESTRNVTAIMDCCHAGRMPRDGDGPGARRARKTDPPWVARQLMCRAHGVTEHIEELKREYGLARLDVEANPYAVRLLACRAGGQAYEFQQGERWHGRMTWALTRVLNKIADGVGDTVSWNNIGQRVRALVAHLEYGDQVPQVEGPRSRLFASLQELDQTGVLAISPVADEFILDGGRAVGVSVGDEYAVCDLVDAAGERDAEIGRVRVSGVEIFNARARRQSGTRAIGHGYPAYPVRVTRASLSVAIRGPAGTSCDEIRAAISASPYLSLAGLRESPRAAIHVAGDAMWLEDALGRRLYTRAWQYDALGIRNAIAALTRMAHAAHVETLADNMSMSRRDIAIEWGRVVDGEREPLSVTGAELRVGERYYVRVENLGIAPIYASVFDVGVAGTVRLVSRAHAEGHEIAPGGMYTLGQDERGSGLVGIELYWNDDVPRDVPREERLLVFATSRPVDLRALETSGAHERERAARHTRDSRFERGPQDWCEIREIRFQLTSMAGPMVSSL